MKIAVILASMEVEYVHDTLQGIMEQERQDKNDLYIFNVNVNSDETFKYNIGEYNLYSLINYKEFDGVILFANMIQESNIFSDVVRLIKHSGVPTVCVDTSIEGFCHVGTDCYRGMRKIVEHFIEYHGMNEFAYISGLEFNSDSRERLRAYCDVLKEHNIPIDEKNIYKGSFTFDCGLEIGQRIIDSGELPQAVICGCDAIAMGVRRVFIENGIKIPEQVALSGFDNSFEARHSVPVLTTVQHDQRRIGMEAAQKINMFIRNNIKMVNEDFPAPLIIGESCGCKSCKKIDEKTIREEYIGIKEHYEQLLHENNVLVEDLNDSKRYDDFIEHLKPHIEKLDCNRCYLCLSPEIVEEMKEIDEKRLNSEQSGGYRRNGYPDKMIVALAYEYGKFVSYKEIDTSQMLPKNETQETEGRVYCFSSVHYRDHCLGYLVVEGSQFVMESPLFRTWMNNLSNCLENFRKQAGLQRLLKHVDSMYIKDALTGLYNRFGFGRYTKESFQHCIKAGKGFMILFVDLDGLKKINDQNGHEKGDLALSTVAAALRECCVGNEICARFGGDEYVVYAQDYLEQDAIEFGKRLEARLQHYNEQLKQSFEISASYGFKIVFPKQGDMIDSYINMADDEMYLQKKKKKQKIQ